MRKKTNNPDFNYEIACDQLCGKGHYGMKGLVVVETQQEFDEWMAKQPSFYDVNIKGTAEEKHFAELTQQLKEKQAKEAAKSEVHSE